jgi:uncharacterized protein (DUF4415 family)
MLIAEGEMMGRARGRPRREGREYVSVRIDKAVVAQAKLIAAREGKSIGDLLSDMLQAPITKAYGRLLRETAGGEE